MADEPEAPEARDAAGIPEGTDAQGAEGAVVPAAGEPEEPRGEIDEARIVEVVRAKVAELEARFNRHETLESLLERSERYHLGWAGRLLEEGVVDDEDPVDDERVVRGFRRFSDLHDVRMTTTSWGGNFAESIVVVAGTGDETGLLAIEMLATVNLDILLRGHEKPNPEKPWKDRALAVKLTRRFLFCLFRAASEHPGSQLGAMATALLNRKFVTTAQPFLRCPLLGSHDLASAMDAPTKRRSSCRSPASAKSW